VNCEEVVVLVQLLGQRETAVVQTGAKVADDDVRVILVDMSEQDLEVGEVACLEVAEQGAWDFAI
jgi:hypothetical protein